MSQAILRVLAIAAGAAAAEVAFRETQKSGSMTSYVDRVVGAGATHLEKGLGRVVDRAVERVSVQVENSIAHFFGMGASPPPPRSAPPQDGSWGTEDIIDAEYERV